MTTTDFSFLKTVGKMPTASRNGKETEEVATLEKAHRTEFVKRDENRIRPVKDRIRAVGNTNGRGNISIRYGNIGHFSDTGSKKHSNKSGMGMVMAHSAPMGRPALWDPSMPEGRSVLTESFNYLPPEIDLAEQETPYAYEQAISSSGLTWPGASAAQLTFLKRVYDINLARVSGRTFVGDVPAANLATVEGRFQLRTNAAASAINLLREARAAAQSSDRNVDLGLTSAYRSASHQFNLWRDYVKNQYYTATQNHRKNLAGGEHGEAAANYLARYTRARIATPGYSSHNDGLAIDLRNIENGTTLRNRTTNTATRAWRNSWLWDWLSAHAATYNFYQNTRINEPWHWVYRPAST